MQAAKIVVGQDYAVKHQGRVKRFRVQRVETHRYDRNTTKSFVKGLVYENVEELHNNQTKEIGIEVSEVLGHYTEHAELVAKAKAEQEERDRLALEKERLFNRSALVLARLLSVPIKLQVGYVPNFEGVEINYQGLVVTKGVLDKVLALGERLGITVSDEEVVKAFPRKAA